MSMSNIYIYNMLQFNQEIFKQKYGYTTFALGTGKVIKIIIKANKNLVEC